VPPSTGGHLLLHHYLCHCFEPQKAEYIWITFKLFPMTILKSMSECGLWTSVGTL